MLLLELFFLLYQMSLLMGFFVNLALRYHWFQCDLSFMLGMLEFVPSSAVHC